MSEKEIKDLKQKIHKLEEKLRNLKNENSLYETIIENLPFGIQVYDENGYAYKLNKKQKELLGVPDENEVIGKYNILKDPLAIKTGASKVYKKSYKGQKYQHSFLFNPDIPENKWDTRKDPRFLSENLFPVFEDPNRVKFVVSIIRDITEEKKSKEQLKEKTEDYYSLYEEYKAQNEDLSRAFQKMEESSELLNNLAARVPGVVYQFRLFPDGSSSFPYTSPGIYEIVELTPEDLRDDATPAFSRIHPNDLEYVVKGINESAKKQQDYHSEFRVKLPRQGIRWRQCDAHPQLLEDGSTLWYGIIMDITERKNAEEKIREQQILLETMFNTITDGVVLTNNKREIILANKGIKTTFGYEPEEIIGKSTQILYASSAIFRETGKAVFSRESIGADDLFETRFRHKNNKVFPGEIFAAKLYDSQREWIGNLGIIRDITERLKYIEELKIAKQKAEESERLKTAFLQNMSHEIRTPMNGIMGFSGLLKEKLNSKEKSEQYLNTIIKSSEQLLSIVNDVIMISTIETQQVNVEHKKFNINEALKDVYLLFEPEARKSGLKLELINGLDNNDAMIESDYSKFTQILSNLTSNSLKFTHKGKITLGYTRKNNLLEFFVKDTGIGIEKKSHKKIFERFQQANLNDGVQYGGTGLGLSISKGLVNLLGGEIWVESQPGAGATFFFTLPYNGND